jgi:sugar lactone lactonase YvrE
MVLLILTTVLFSGCGAKVTLLIKYEGQGAVLPNPEGPYKKRTVVELKATAADGYSFSHWDGPDGASVKDNKIIMDDNKSIVAVFVKPTYDLTVNFVPEDSGTVEVELVEDKSVHKIEPGQTVKITPKPNVGYKFAYWDNDPGKMDNPRTMVIESNTTITAHFVPVLEGRVIGSRTGDPLDKIPIGFSDGIGALSDANGYWAKKYDPASPPSGPVTITPILFGLDWKIHSPASVTVDWPAEEVVFEFEGCRYIATWYDFDSGNDRFNLPNDVTVDQLGNVFVTDSNNHRILKLSSDGNLILKFGSEGNEDGQFNYPTGIAADASGNIYVADYYNNRIQKFDQNGEHIVSWGTSGNENGQFDHPTDVAVDSNGNVYVADSNNSRIQKFTSEGNFVTAWGSPGNGASQLNMPYGVTVDEEDNIYVTEPQKHCIKKFSSDGEHLATWGSYGTGHGQFHTPCGVAVDARGNIYVAECNNKRIQILTESGEYLIAWEKTAGGTIEFYYPRGVAVDSNGNIYVASTNANCIVKSVHVD